MDYMRSLSDQELFRLSRRAWLLLTLALTALSALPQVAAQDLETERLCGNRLSISWGDPPGARGYQFTPVGDEDANFRCSKNEPNCVVKLKPGETYTYYLDRVTEDGLVYGEAITLSGKKTESCPEYNPAKPPPPPVDTCAHLPADIVVRGFHPFSTQCRQVGNAGVGNAELIAQGILRAVDVWGNANADIRVCFHQQGQLKFLDAATSPRAVSDLAAETIEGMTCGRINRAGTVVLLPGAQPVQMAMETVAETIESQPPAEQAGPSSTTSCELETTGYLSLRSGPSVNYARLTSMPLGTSLVASARIGDWYMVNYEGQLGWASAAYLALSPGCAGLGGTSAVILPPMTEVPMPESAVAMTQASETMLGDLVEEVAQTLTRCTVSAGDIINLRLGPGLEHGIIAEIPFQTRMSATGRSGDWFLVDYPDMAGWVNIDYVFRNGACG